MVNFFFTCPKEEITLILAIIDAMCSSVRINEAWHVAPPLTDDYFYMDNLTGF